MMRPLIRCTKAATAIEYAFIASLISIADLHRCQYNWHEFDKRIRHGRVQLLEAHRSAWNGADLRTV
jgi:hypothetical protein